MKSLFIIFSLFITTPLLADDLLDKAATAMRKAQYKSANQYARKAWDSKKTLYASFLLANGYYHLRVKDSAAFFARTALSDKTIKKDVRLKENQIETLKKILVCCAPHDKAGEYGKIYYLSHRTTTEWYMIEGNKEKSAPPKFLIKAIERHTWKEYLDTLKQNGVSPTVLMELKSIRKEGEWIIQDTSEIVDIKIDTVSINWISEEGVQEKIFLPSEYPELYESRTLLTYPMMKIYKEFLNGNIDQSNYHVERYGLNEKTTVPFLNRVFPEIIQNANNLDSWIEKYE